MKKFLLSEDQLSHSIPTLSDRQFVVQKSKLSDSEAKAQRELFWYREELFKCVRGRWREVSLISNSICLVIQATYQSGGIRSGDLSLRQQRMTLPMLETIRMENTRVHMSLVSYSNPSKGDEPIIHRGGKYYPPADEFVYLRTKVTNLSRTSSKRHFWYKTEI